jgi:2-polyprenyl-3-methyl-5-hydroxy-6-metoxy-1,4-benzoquinol methylase
MVVFFMSASFFQQKKQNLPAEKHSIENTSLDLAKVKNVETFLHDYPEAVYQDIIVGNQTLRQGINMCSIRYEMIKPILNLYKRQFTVLDVGAAQGYFSFSIARDYPHATCVMIEDNTCYYSYHGDMLYDLCELNSDLHNIIYLQNKVSLSELQYLNKQAHFDVILALLVIHQIDDSLDQQKAIVDNLLSLGDLVIIEVANDVAVPLTEYIESFSKQIDCKFLGEVRRTYNPNAYGGYYPNGIGKVFCFSMKNRATIDFVRKNPSICFRPETFLHMNRIYP